MKKIFCLALMLIVAFAPISYARGGGHSGGHVHGGSVHVRSSVTKSGVYRQAHHRTSPNNTKGDNWSTKGNVNPYTGQAGTKNP